MSCFNVSEATHLCKLLGMIQYRVKFIIENIEGVIAIGKFQYEERCDKNQKQCDQPLIKAETLDIL